MATITIYASTNIKNVAYAAGDTLAGSNSTNSVVVLTIDAQDPLDVAKVEGTLIGGLAITFAGEILFKNTSTTTPLVITFSSGARTATINSQFSIFKTRGAWMNIGTGTGALGQTLNMLIGGKAIDWIPFVQVESAAGSGEYITLLNINGAYNDSTNTAYTTFGTFADVGTTTDLGAFFEYDEYNGGVGYGQIKFATAAGGWVPPAGANIRYPNIHFTAAKVAGQGAQGVSIGTTPGNYDFECTGFSYKWAHAGQSWPFTLRYKDVGAISWGSNNIPGTIAIDGYYCGMTPWAAGATGGAIGTSSAKTTVKNVHTVSKASNGFSLVGTTSPVEIGYIKGTILSRSSAFVYPITLSSIIGNESAPLNIGPLVGVGGNIAFNSNENVRLYDFTHSDKANGIATSLLPASMFYGGLGGKNVVIEKIRLAQGGCPCYGAMFSTTGYATKQYAIHDVVYDCKNPQTSAPWMALICVDMSSERMWIANFSLPNLRGALFAKGTLGKPPGRISNITAPHTSFSETAAGVWYEMVDVTTAAGNQTISADNYPCMVRRTNVEHEVGTFVMQLGGRQENLPIRVVKAGVDGADFFAAGYFTMPVAGVEVEVSSCAPVCGITSFSSAALVFDGVSATSGVAYEFKIRNWGAAEDWSPSWTTLTLGNFQAAFDALTGYSSSVGFEIKVRLVTSTNLFGRTLHSIRFTGATLDAAFVPSEVGFIQIGIVGSVPDAVYATQDISGAVVQRTFNTVPVSGEFKAEHPYAFNGTPALFRVVVRKPGFSEYLTDSSCYQAGATLPAPLVAAHPATNAAVAGIALDGVAKTITVTGTKTFQEVYQQSQYWSCLAPNMIRDIPMTSSNGDTFAVPLDWKISWSIPSDKVLAGGWLLLAAGTHNLKLSGTKIECTTAGTYNFGGTVFSGTVELVNTSGGAVTVQLPSGTSYTNTGPSITVTVAVDQAHGLVSGIVAGSRLQVYNVTTATEMYNAIIAGTTYTVDYDNGTGYNTNDVVRVRLTYCSGLDAKLPAEYLTIASVNGWSVLAGQADDEVYIANGVIGSTVTEYGSDYANVQIDISDGDGTTTIQRGYAWYCYQMTLIDGIRYFYGAFVAEDALNYLLDTDVADIKVQNTNMSTGVTLTGGALRRKDGSSPIAAGGSIYLYYGRTYGLETGVSGLTAPESDKLLSLPTASAIWSNSTRTLTALGASVPTAAENAAATRTELSTELGRIDATVSSRLATSGYAAPATPPTTGQIVAALEATTIPVDVQKMNGVTVFGSGVESDKWRGNV